MATIVDVAKLAGVSISTVSNVINGTRYVGKDLTEKVNEAIEQLGYKTNGMAASMKRRETHNIGVVLPNVGMLFFPEVLSGIETAARDLGYGIFYFSTDYAFEREKAVLSIAKSGWVDGIILDSCCPQECKEEYQDMLLEEVNGKAIPVVAIENPFPSPDIGVIEFDRITFTKQVMDHLIEMGNTDIGVLVGREYATASEVLTACEECYKMHGLKFRKKQIIRGDYMAESGYIEMTRALKRGVTWTALISENDQMAIGAIKALKENGKSVPEDVAVAGADGLFVTTLIEPTLTTVETPKFEMGYRSVTMLVDMIKDGPEKCDHIRLAGRMIVRKSTDINAHQEWDLRGW